MREKLLEYALTRLSAPQYDEFCKVLRKDPEISASTKIYWLEVVELYLGILNYSEDEICMFIGGLICPKDSYKE